METSEESGQRVEYDEPSTECSETEQRNENDKAETGPGKRKGRCNEPADSDAAK